MVVGVVEKSFGLNYVLDINAGASAILPALAFSGATKRNRPNLGIGAMCTHASCFVSKILKL